MNDPARTSRLPGLAWLRPALGVGLAICLVGYAAFLVRYISPYAGGADSSGYLNSARLLSQGRLMVSPRVLPGHAVEEFGGLANVPLGFTPRPGGRMAPTYPTGYPMQLVGGAALGWTRAVIVVNVMTALASGVLFFAFCRLLGLSVASALGGIALFWLCPLFLFSVFQPMSDSSAAFWTLAALYGAVRSHEKWPWGLASGMALGLAVLVRPTNLLLVVPILAAIGVRPKIWLAVGLGGLPGAAFFCLYNWRVYGSPLVTGYGDVWSAFGWANVPHNLVHFSHWIPVLLTPLIVLAVAAPFAAAGRQRGLVVLMIWAVSLIGFYAFYFHSGETWWYLRFILPAFPALLLAALAVLDTAWRWVRPRTGMATIGLATFFSFCAVWEGRQIRQLDVLHIKDGERTYLDAARWAQQHLPANSVVFCMQVSGAFFHYTDFLLFRWDQIESAKFGALLEAAAQQDRPIYAALFSFETVDAQARIGGHWTKLATVGQATFWQRLP